VPGLIPGASQGKGLGLEFLRHVERCSVLVHVIDCATLEPDRDPLTDLDVIEAELAAYQVDEGGVSLADRPRIVVLNKIDVPEARELAELVRPELQARGLEVHLASAASHEGLKELGYAMARLVGQARAAAPPPVATRAVLRPAAVDDAGFTVRVEAGPEGPHYRVRGAKPERWVRQTDFTNDEAVGYLADRLQRLGVEDALFEAGAVAGAEVVIGGGDDAVVFDWEPTLMASAGTMAGPRGSDLRLEDAHRPSRDARREAYEARRVSKREARAELDAERHAGHWTEPDVDDVEGGGADDVEGGGADDVEEGRRP